MDAYSLLLDSINQDIPRYSLDSLTLQGMVMSVYDGDTCDLALYIPNEHQVKRYSVRMLSYDAPEMRVSRLIKYEEREQCHQVAIRAKEQLGKFLGLDQSVRPMLSVECKGWDKYGRLLARVCNGDICVNDEMLKYTGSTPYDGGRKK